MKVVLPIPGMPTGIITRMVLDPLEDEVDTL